MARLADGDRAVFQQVYEHLRAPVERLCNRLLADSADSADAFQEAMQKIFERASADYDRTRPALPWAMAIAGWECRTIRQKRRRRRETIVAEEASSQSQEDSTELALAQRELVEASRRALGVLSDVDQEVLRATFWDEAVSVNGATMRKRRERALSRLRLAFRRLYGLEGS